MSLTRRLIVPTVVALIPLGLAACGSSGSGSTATTVTETTTAAAAPQDTDAGAPEADRAPGADAEAQDNGGMLEVTVRGDQGVLGLQYSGSVPAGTPGPASNKLITGPGGCFAFVGAGAPQLAIFPSDATFVLQNGKPSVTVDGAEHPVGRELTFDTAVVPDQQVAGLPERCTRGAADTVLVVL